MARFPQWMWFGFCWLCFLAEPAAGANEALIVVKGSDTLGARLMPRLREAFQQQRVDALFEISAEGSSTGIAAVMDGRAHLAMASRDLTESERARAARGGVELQAVVVAYDAIAVVVNAANPLTALSREEVEKIFAGDYRDWIALGISPGRISPYIRNAASGTHAAFRQLAMRGRDYGTHARLLAGNERIADEVASTPGAIGYLGLAYIRTSGLKMVSIDGSLPEREAVAAGRYPYIRPLYFVFNAADRQPALQAFLAWVNSSEGQREVAGAGFIPVSIHDSSAQ